MAQQLLRLRVDLLLTELKNVVEWDTLGTYLGLSPSAIKQIERDHQTTERRRIEMLDLWLRKEPDPSWERVITALEGMYETSLASYLRDKYLQQTNEVNIEPSAEQTELTLDRKDLVSISLETIKESYTRLLMSAGSALKVVKPSSQQLKIFSRQYMSNRVVSTIEELIDYLAEFSFLDYALLEYTISMFLKEIQHLVSDFNEYVKQLNQFKTSNTISKFMQSIENAQNSREGDAACTVTLRLVGGWLEKTMEDLDSLLKIIFRNKKSILAHLKIVRGSVMVSYLAPQSEIDSLEKLAQQQVSFLPKVGVYELTIGHNIIAVMSIEKVIANYSFESSLIEAVKNNDINLLSFLLRINTSPNAIDSSKWTALMYGSNRGRYIAVSILLQNYANPNLQGDNGVTAVYIAAQNGYTGVVSILLQGDANPNLQRDNGVTPLYVAAQNGHSDAVSVLKANADPNLQAGNGVTPLFMAAQNGYSDIVSILIQMDANPNLQKHNGVTPLYMATKNGHYDTVSVLLQANADPDLERDDGVTPLLIAVQNGYSEIVRILLEADANPNLEKDDGTTPLMLACLYSYPQIVKLLLTNGADPNVQHSDGFTALMCACYTGCLDSTELLLMSGAGTSEVQTVIDIAISNGHNDIIDLILQVIGPSQSSITTPVLEGMSSESNSYISSLLRNVQKK